MEVSRLSQREWLAEARRVGVPSASNRQCCRQFGSIAIVAQRDTHPPTRRATLSIERAPLPPFLLHSRITILPGTLIPHRLRGRANIQTLLRRMLGAVVLVQVFLGIEMGAANDAIVLVCMCHECLRLGILNPHRACPSTG